MSIGMRISEWAKTLDVIGLIILRLLSFVLFSFLPPQISFLTFALFATLCGIQTLKSTHALDQAWWKCKKKIDFCDLLCTVAEIKVEEIIHPDDFQTGAERTVFSHWDFSIFGNFKNIRAKIETRVFFLSSLSLLFDQCSVNSNSSNSFFLLQKQLKFCVGINNHLRFFTKFWRTSKGT